MRRLLALAGFGVVVCGGVAALAASGAAAPTTVLISQTSAGVPADGGSPGISADGRYVVFASDTALVPQDTNGASDVYLRDELLGTLTLVSVSSSGAIGNDQSFYPALSADGRFVAFASYATNLTAVDTNGRTPDIYLRNLAIGKTNRVSLSSKGAQGKYQSILPQLSTHGRFVSFNSIAGNLVPGDDNHQNDVFLRDRRRGTLQRVSVSDDGKQSRFGGFGGAISGSGRYVVFTSESTDLVAADTNDAADVFVRDVRSKTTTRVSVTDAGGQSNGASGVDEGVAAISSDGRYVAFSSDATNLVAGDTNHMVDAFVRDLVAGTTQRVNLSTSGAQDNGGVSGACCVIITSDGLHVVFTSYGDTLVGGDTNESPDVFEIDLATGAVRRVSLSDTGHQGNSTSFVPVSSADGACVAFYSWATNLISGQTLSEGKVYLRKATRACP